jgi:hypothetical protein
MYGKCLEQRLAPRLRKEFICATDPFLTCIFGDPLTWYLPIMTTMFFDVFFCRIPSFPFVSMSVLVPFDVRRMCNVVDAEALMRGLQVTG